MSNRVPSISRDHVLLLIIISLIGFVVWLFLNPATEVTIVSELTSLANDMPLDPFIWRVTILLIVIGFIRLIGGTRIKIDRSPIVEKIPEMPEDTGVPGVAALVDTRYTEVQNWFVNPSRAGRHVAMYGRRAPNADAVPDEVTQFLDELATTARDTYATAASCDIETADRAINTGGWTDDRIAAAFLTPEREAEPSFTVRERLTAWLSPQQAFDNRVEHVVSAIEETADVYLTYEKTTDEGDPKEMQSAGARDP